MQPVEFLEKPSVLETTLRIHPLSTELEAEGEKKSFGFDKAIKKASHVTVSAAEKDGYQCGRVSS